MKKDEGRGEAAPALIHLHRVTRLTAMILATNPHDCLFSGQGYAS